MTAIQELKNEHRAIEVALGVLVALAQHIHESGAAGDAERLLDFFRTFADQCHHAKEEKHLFPALEKSGVPKQGGPIGVMLAEHDVGRNHVRGMAQSLEGLKGDQAQSAESFGQHAQAYAGMLRQHILKEDQVLFVMADKRLSSAQKQTLLEDFERVEKEIVGAGKHEIYHRLLDELSLKYRK